MDAFPSCSVQCRGGATGEFGGKRGDGPMRGAVPGQGAGSQRGRGGGARPTYGVHRMDGSATLARSVRLFRAFRPSRPIRTGSTASSPRTRSPALAVRRPWRAPRSSTSVAARATSPTPSARRCALRRPGAGRGGAGRPGARPARHGAGQRRGAADPDRGGGRLLLVERPRARAGRPWTMTAEMVRVTGRAGSCTCPSRRGCRRGAGTRPRRGTTSAVTGRAPLPPADGGGAEEPLRRVLFAVTVGRAVRWARCCPDADLVAVYPRYHPWWAGWVARVPGLREIVSWNVVLVMRCRSWTLGRRGRAGTGRPPGA